jgi:hypothetical protein
VIENLTPEQTAKFPEYVKKWTDIGLQTKPLDVDAIKACFKKVYKLGGLTCPKQFVFVGSPEEGHKLTGTLNYVLYGAHDANWLAFYDFFRNECGLVAETDKLVGLLELASLAGWCWTSLDTVIISDNPLHIHMKDRLLHCDNGPAILYGDGFAVYALNGIRMKKEYVMTPASELSVETVMREENVDIRRELLRKIGLERFIEKTNAKLVDEYTVSYNGKSINYKLLDIELGEDVTARVLKMDNPSINAIHVEGVEETCKTVKEALAWRMGLDEYVEPEQLT